MTNRLCQGTNFGYLHYGGQRAINVSFIASAQLRGNDYGPLLKIGEAGDEISHKCMSGRHGSYINDDGAWVTLIRPHASISRVFAGRGRATKNDRIGQLDRSEFRSTRLVEGCLTQLVTDGSFRPDDGVFQSESDWVAESNKFRVAQVKSSGTVRSRIYLSICGEKSFVGGLIKSTVAKCKSSLGYSGSKLHHGIRDMTFGERSLDVGAPA